MTPAKGEQQESPNSLGETEELWCGRPGEHCTGELRQTSCFLSSVVQACHPLSWLSAVGEGSMHTAVPCSTRWTQPLCVWCIGMPGDSPQVTMGSGSGQSNAEGALFCHGASTQEMPAAALALGYPPHRPQGAQESPFSHQQHQLVARRQLRSKGVQGQVMWLHQLLARAQLQSGQTQALSEHCSFRSSSHPVPIHPRAQSLKGGN